LVVGLSNGVATAYNVRSRKYTRIFDPATTGWRAPPGMLVWGGNRVCIAEAPQDDGYRIACAARDGSRRWAIDLHAQTVNGKPFPVSFRAQPASLPRTIGIHAITLAPDGKWLAIDTHGNTPCSVPNLPNYAATALFLNLETNTGYDGNLDTAITIRSAVMTADRIHLTVGAGIVAGSVPEREFEETEHKAGAIRRALEQAVTEAASDAERGTHLATGAALAAFEAAPARPVEASR
jgi:hypothetical protein